MTKQTPRHRGSEANRPAQGWVQRLRAQPGFKAAAVAFLTTVILGSGTIAAVANWQQSSTATIAITAGALPTLPPPGPGTVVIAPALAVRPEALVGNYSCTLNKHQSVTDFTFSWPAAANTTSYALNLSLAGAGNPVLASQTVATTTAVFSFRQADLVNGASYEVRIQPFNGSSAGGAVYKTITYSPSSTGQCDQVTPAATSPLGTLNVSALPAVRGATTSTMAVTWTGSTGATSYVVTVKSTTSSYGAEFTTSSLAATLTFPQAATNAAGQLINPADATAPYYSDYSFRIQPMNGSTAGDPVYKTIKYYFSSSSMG
jgi:hypothetical protein